MLVPVFAASWEIECCQPEAEIGEQWDVPVSFRAEVDPWYVTEFGAAASDEVIARGRVTLDIEVVRTIGDYVVATDGRVYFLMQSADVAQNLTGRLWLDAHREPDATEAQIHGVVKMVELIPLCYRPREEREFVPAEAGEPITVSSSAERYQRADLTPGVGMLSHEVLVWLEVE